MIFSACRSYLMGSRGQQKMIELAASRRHPLLWRPARLASLARLALLATLLAVGSHSAGAQIAPTAEDLAQQAAAFIADKDYEQAVNKFRSALEIDPQRHLFRFQLARLLAALGRYEEARAEFATVVAAAPTNSEARRGEVTALLLQERYAEARSRLEDGLTALPQDGQLAHTLARLLASAPLDEVRDPALALRLAQSVYEVKKLYETAETLAMAHAASGDFTKALEIQRGLITRAESEDDAARLESLRQRFAAYEQSRPWRAASPVEIATATAPPDAGP